MLEWDSVFARYEKFDRFALAKARDVGSSARIDPTSKDRRARTRELATKQSKRSDFLPF
jgi:hypothetical protein